MDQNKTIKQVTLPITQESLDELNQLATEMKVSPLTVLGLGINLIKLANGRKVIFKQKNNPVEIFTTKFESFPVQRHD